MNIYEAAKVAIKPTIRDRMLRVMDDIITVIDRIAADENAKPEEIAALPALANCLVQISAYAVIEKKS